MADSVSIKEDMTSVEAGLTETQFESRRLSLRWEVAGRERRRRPCVEGLEEVLAEVLSGITGPLGAANMTKKPEVSSQNSKGRQDQRMGSCKGG